MRKLTNRRRHSRRSGQSLVEFALVAPILIVLLVGAAQVGLLVYDYVSIGTAAREGARIGTENPDTSGLFSGGAPVGTLSPACTSTNTTNPVCVAIYKEANNGSNFGLIDTTKITAVVTSSSPYRSGTACVDASLPNDGLVTVSVSYPVPIFVPLIGQFFSDSGNPAQRTLTRTVTMRIAPCSVTRGQ